jgi:diaminopimelate epimerase
MAFGQMSAGGTLRASQGRRSVSPEQSKNNCRGCGRFKLSGMFPVEHADADETEHDRLVNRPSGLISKPMPVRFLKMHGCGNDFVVLDDRAQRLGLTQEQAIAIADRHRGIGCDQVIVMEQVDFGADVFMRIRNPDGTEAGACGNATRCVAHLLAEENGRLTQIVRTISGDLACDILVNGQVRVDMGPVRLDWRDIPLARPMDTLDLELTAGPVSHPAAANMGNPHATFFVSDLDAVPISTVGPVLERDPLFPERANIGFAEVLSPEKIALRVWERGVGVTLACGSAACAAIVNSARRGLTGRQAIVLVDGGELIIEWRADDHVLMTGPVATSFTGEVDLAALPPR